MAKTSILYKQYFDLKEKHTDYMLFFKVGDFFNVYGLDAIMFSNLFNLVITKRDGVSECGVCKHSFDTYKNLLVDKGISVAIAEKKPNTPRNFYAVTKKFDAKKQEVIND